MFALKGRQSTCPDLAPMLTKGNELSGICYAVNDGAEENLDQFSGDWNSITTRCITVRARPNPPPLQGENLFWMFPGLKPWAEGCAPSGHKPASYSAREDRVTGWPNRNHPVIKRPSKRVFSRLAAGNGADDQEWLPTRGNSFG